MPSSDHHTRSETASRLPRSNGDLTRIRLVPAPRRLNVLSGHGSGVCVCVCVCVCADRGNWIVSDTVGQGRSGHVEVIVPFWSLLDWGSVASGSERGQRGPVNIFKAGVRWRMDLAGQCKISGSSRMAISDSITLFKNTQHDSFRSGRGAEVWERWYLCLCVWVYLQNCDQKFALTFSGHP